MSKKEKSLPEKVKQFFGKRESVPINFDKLKKEKFILNNDIFNDISSKNSLSQRLKSLKDLYEIVLTKTLENYAVEALCKHVEDLLDVQNSTETRHIAFHFYTALIQGQMEQMTIMRTYLFRLLAQHTVEEDTVPRLEMLKELSENGKNITYFEEEIGPFLLLWFPQIFSTGKTAEFLPLVTNVIKFNAAYLYDDTVAGFIECISIYCSKTNSDEDLQECLNILDAILCYSHVPDYVLPKFIHTLCVTVNMEQFSQCSWKLMRNLLGTNAGHTSIFILCLILQDKNNYKQASLVRGAVFFIGMALWGSNRVQTLTHSPAAVLPSFFRALESNDSIIAYEIVLSLQRLVKKSGEVLRNLCWEMVFDIIEKVLEYPELQDFSNPMSVLAKSLHDLITIAEENCSELSHERLFKIIERCADARNEQSVIKLILYNYKSMSPFKEDFLSKMNKLLEKYFKQENRTGIQFEVLKIVKELRNENMYFFEADLLDQNILQFMSHVENISSVSIRKAVVTFLTEMAETCASSLFFDLIENVEKVLKMMFENYVDSGQADTSEAFSDVLAAVEGLTEVFKKKYLIGPSSHCIKIYSLLTNHLQQQYNKLLYFENAVQVRKLVLQFLLQFRANNKKQIGFIIKDKLEYSVYISYDSSYKETSESAPISPVLSSPAPFIPQNLLYLGFQDAFQVIIIALKEEKDWGVLEGILSELPKILQNKALIVGGNCNVSTLCFALCMMVNDRNLGFPESLKNAPAGLNRTEVQCRVFPCVAALTSYYSQMESHIQRLLIKCLQSGLVSRSAKICMEALTLCSLEMQNSMIKLLPDVLLKLSKISATKGVAVSVLEFLSNLIRLPNLYISFVEDQYMSIFAIALPYTNPFRFNQYTVALAHHVIAMWFLKCRIPFRKDFAKFITKGLRSNINIPCEENNRNKDSSQNTEEGSCEKSEMSNAAIIALHKELMETGLDLMSRFTFGMCSNVPKRSPTAEFLLEKGQKNSWLVGNKIVTVATSGCGTKSFKHGLCERCYSSCRDINKSLESDESDSIFMEPKASTSQSSDAFNIKRKKRHRSAVQRRNTTLSREMFTNANQTKDDILLHFPRHHSSGSLSHRQTTYFPNDSDTATGSYGEWSLGKKEKEEKSGHLCSCWCTSWAEVHIRRPTGNTSWMMKIQNQLFLPSSPPEFPLSVINSLVLPQKRDLDVDDSLPSTEEECSDLNESQLGESSDGAIEILPCSKPTPPVRRTNSSPDMNTGFLHCEKLATEQQYEKLEASNDFERDSLLCQESEIEEKDENSSKNQALNSKGNLKLDLPSKSRTVGLKFSKEKICEPSSAKILSSTESQQQASMSSFRDRGHTISVMSPSRPNGSENSVKRPELNRRSGMSPSFVFLQLFHNSCFGPVSHKPLLLLQTEANNRALSVLDHIPPYDTHKIGVVYVGPGQVDNEVAILSNIYGSTRYVNLLRGLGNLVRLTDVDPQTYLGGLDTRGEDGKFALIWQDDVMQVVFHVSTLMFNKENDPMRNEKKKHIANDSVVIVYNESGEDFQLSTIKGQVTNACVTIRPEDYNCNIVSVQLKTNELMETFGHSESYTVSDESLPVFVRQMALHANLASLIISRRQHSSKYTHVSNWLERLRTIKRLRSKVLEELKKRNDGLSSESSSESVNYDDFTDYV